MVAGVDEGRVRKLLLKGLLVREAQFQLALFYKDRRAPSECLEELTCVGDMLWSCGSFFFFKVSFVAGGFYSSTRPIIRNLKTD